MPKERDIFNEIMNAFVAMQIDCGNGLMADAESSYAPGLEGLTMITIIII